MVVFGVEVLGVIVIENFGIDLSEFLNEVFVFGFLRDFIV